MPLSSPLLSALDQAVKVGFQALRDSYFLKLQVCTWIVVTGVFIEEAEYVASWQWLRNLLPIWMLVPKHRLDSWVTALSRIGWVLIILGVAGEGAYESLVSRADGLLQEFSNTLLATAQRQAADAIGEAGRANERAYNNEKEAARLTKQGEALKKVAEDEGLARVRLQKLVAWRTITESDQKNIGARLKRSQGIRIGFTVNAGDPEGYAFATQIAAIALEAGWQIGFFAPIAHLGGFQSGITIGATGDANTHDAANALARALTALGFTVARSPDIDSRSTSTIVVAVELRPQAIPR